MTRRLVWITRAEPDAWATARRVTALGRNPLIAPLLRICPLSPCVNLEDVAAIAFTSANAVAAFAALTTDRRLPVYAVGRRTADAASDRGFKLAGVGDGGVENLARLLIERHSPARGGVLHPSALEPAGDLTGSLRAAGIAAERLPVYAAEPVAALPQTAAERLTTGDVETVLIHSPRAAEALASLVHSPLGRSWAMLRVVGLSPACLEPLASTALAERLAADRPTEQALLALL